MNRYHHISSQLIQYFAVIIWCLFSLTACAQSIDPSLWYPQSYISFDGEEENNSPGKPELGYDGGTGTSKATVDGIRNGYALFQRGKYDPIRLTLEADTAYTLECWLKFSKNINLNSAIFRTLNSSLGIFIGHSSAYLPWIRFTTRIPGITDDHTIPLTGTGRYSLDYYFDNNWHHFVFKYNSITGQKEIWVDGESPEGFQRKVEQVGNLCAQGSNCKQVLLFSENSGNGRQFDGKMDELMVYNRFVPSSVHKGHIDEAREKRPYSYKEKGRQLRREGEDEYRPIGKRVGFDPQEFAPEHPSVQIMPIDQLTAFPTPRFKRNNTLYPLFNWISPIFFGGIKLPGVDNVQAIKYHTLLQEEMAKYWNYSIVLHNARVVEQDETRDYSKSIAKQILALANQYPNLPFSLTTLWGQSIHTRPDGKQHFAYVYQKDLPAKYYLRDDKNNWLDQFGNVTAGPSVISPAADTDLFVEDGKMQAKYIRKVISQLNPGRKILMINENGEVPFQHFPKGVLEQSRVVKADKDKMGIKDWNTYQARKKTIHRNAYKDVFLKNIPEISDAHFSWYRISGERPNSTFTWNESRKVMTRLNGQYYSTTNFYVVRPSIWYGGSGPWNGWQNIIQSRNSEIPLGDILYSPFVSPGWYKDPEVNTRPSQWLGLLKCLSVTGAEFYYVGIFAEGVGSDEFADPRNYVWQVAIPSYAQAVSSHYEDILRNGMMLRDSADNLLVNHDVGDRRVLVTVRKHRNKELYVIAGTIQPASNVMGNIPDRKKVSVEIEGESISFFVRRQGSVYIYDKTKGGQPAFYQLDSWHETGHPWWWSQDILIEGEVYDKGVNVERKTNNRTYRKGDYTNFISYVSLNPAQNSSVSYGISISEKQNKKVKKILLMLSSPEEERGTLTAYWDGVEIGEVKNVDDNSWNWYKIKLNKEGKKIMKECDREYHQIELKVSDYPLNIDKLLFEVKTEREDVSDIDPKYIIKRMMPGPGKL